MDNRHSEISHLTSEGRHPLKITLGIILVVMVAEIIGGTLSGSLALLGDAGHMLVDALALGLALFAITIARRPATPSKTYGYHRVEIMVALANGVTLALVAAYIFYEAYQRFLAPPCPDSSNVIGGYLWSSRQSCRDVSTQESQTWELKYESCLLAYRRGYHIFSGGNHRRDNYRCNRLVYS